MHAGAENLSEQGREPTTKPTHQCNDESGNQTRDKLLGGEYSHDCVHPVP